MSRVRESALIRYSAILACLSLATIPLGCSDDGAAGCRKDEDCAGDELCDLISGTCVSGEATGEEGEFDGEFTCQVGETFATAPFSGTTSVKGVWLDDTLRLQDYDLCYIETDGVHLGLELHGTRNEDDQAAHYIIYALARLEDLDGDASLERAGGGDPSGGEFTAILFRAVTENGRIVENPVQVGEAVEGTLHVSGAGEANEHLEGSLELMIDAL